MSNDQEERFEFGANWQSFLELLDEERIEQAVESLRQNLDVHSLKDKRFLDLGCGSGLFSLAAHRLGATVVSVDYDRNCVACTKQLHVGFDSGDDRWAIQQGSALDETYMIGLGEFDVVYSWGVLHHTGEMWRAIELASQRVAVNGKLMIAIYNDQGSASRRWHWIKQTYNRLPGWLQPAWVCAVASVYEAKFALTRLARGKNPLPFADWRAKKADRGMSAWHDWVDWVGGLPFEVATPDEIIMPLRRKGFLLDQIKTVGSGWGCNEYVFHFPGNPLTRESINP